MKLSPGILQACAFVPSGKPVTVASRAPLASFDGTFANPARLEKAFFHEIGGKDATTKPRISLDAVMGFV